MTTNDDSVAQEGVFSAESTPTFEGRAVTVMGVGSALSVTTRAQAAVAEVEARYKLAMLRPRNPDEAYSRLVRECQRPAFADEASWEIKFGSQSVSGGSIRYAEACMQAWGNMGVDMAVIEDRELDSTLRVTSSDYERGTHVTLEAVAPKLVERYQAKRGQRVYGTRTNSSGDTVHLVMGAPNEKMGAVFGIASRLFRNCIQRTVPGWFWSNGLLVCEKTLANKVATDPDAAKRELITAFAAINVSVEDLETIIGHSLDKCTPPEIVKLRKLYTGVQGGEIVIGSVLEQMRKQNEENDPKKSPVNIDTVVAKVKLDAKPNAPKQEPPKQDAAKQEALKQDPKRTQKDQPAATQAQQPSAQQQPQQTQQQQPTTAPQQHAQPSPQPTTQASQPATQQNSSTCPKSPEMAFVKLNRIAATPSNPNAMHVRDALDTAAKAAGVDPEDLPIAVFQEIWSKFVDGAASR